MSTSLTAADRTRIANQVGVNPATLYQSMTGRGGLHPVECVRIERDSKEELRRWDLRPKDWWLIWPEIVGLDGAPKVPKTKPATKAKQVA